MGVEKLLGEAQALIADCKTYNFGLRNADKLAHDVAPRLVEALAAQNAAMDRLKASRLDKVFAEMDAIEAAASESDSGPRLVDLEEIAEDHALCADRLTVETEKWERARDAIGRVRNVINTHNPEESGLDPFTLAHVTAALDGKEVILALTWELGEATTHGRIMGTMEAAANCGPSVPMRRRPAGPWVRADA